MREINNGLVFSIICSKFPSLTQEKLIGNSAISRLLLDVTPTPLTMIEDKGKCMLRFSRPKNF